MSMKIN